MNRLASSEKLIKNLPFSANRGLLISQIISANFAFYAYYQLSSGPSKVSLKRRFTLTPDSGIQSVLTYNFCHTEALPLIFNSAVLATLGANHIRSYGQMSFLRVFGLGCAASAVICAIDARHNPEQVQAGFMGASAAFIAHATFKNPGSFRMMRVPAVGWLGAMLMYGLVYDDKAALSGVLAGYSAFLLAL